LRPHIVGRGRVNIALVIDTLTPGGAERVLISLANGLDHRRFHVHVITTREPGRLACELTPDVSLHSLNRRSRRDLQAIQRFAEMVSRHEIQLVHTHSHTAAYFAELARRCTRQPWLHVMHDHHGPIEESALLRIVDWLLLRGLDYYFAVSGRLERYGARWLALRPGTRERLTNGVAIPKDSRASKSSVFTIAHVAHLTPAKNQQMALAVATRLRAELPAFRWLLIGDASSAYGKACHEAIDRLGLKEHVVLTGERSDVASILATAHVGVLTSRSEGLPVALLELMAARLPVVVTDAGDCGALVRASGGGAVVACDDVAGFAAALRRLRVDPAAAELAGTANYVHVRDHYTVEAMVARVAEVYEALLARRPVACRA